MNNHETLEAELHALREENSRLKDEIIRLQSLQIHSLETRLKHPLDPPNRHIVWSQPEIDALIQLVAEGTPHQEIGLRLQRPHKAVTAKVYDLRQKGQIPAKEDGNG